MDFFVLVALFVFDDAHACMMSPKRQLELFQSFDTDHDGKLTQQEYVKGETERLDKALKPFEGMPNMPSRFSASDLEKRFSDMDEHKRGFITAETFRPVSLTRC